MSSSQSISTIAIAETSRNAAPAQGVALRAWDGALKLGFARSANATKLVKRIHHGPLTLQKSLYPEGEEVCHAIILHPPGGVAAGDALAIDLAVGTNAHALITTPGATKWYKSDGIAASQSVTIQVAAGGVMEWLPQENIVFDAARARLSSRVQLRAQALYLGWEVCCLGRRAAGEAFTRGFFRQETEIIVENRCIWLERARLDANSRLMGSSAGLGGHSVFGTLLAAGRSVSALGLGRCRALQCEEGVCGVTALEEIFCARYLGDSTAVAREYFTKLWDILRPDFVARPARIPRIWRT